MRQFTPPLGRALGGLGLDPRFLTVIIIRKFAIAVFGAHMSQALSFKKASMPHALNQAMSDGFLSLYEVSTHQKAWVETVIDDGKDDPIAQRLRELGFVKDEPIEVKGRGLLGHGPHLIKIGQTRFALRRKEALRVQVRLIP